MYKNDPARPLPPLGFESGMFASVDPEGEAALRRVRHLRMGLMRHLGLCLTRARHDALLDEMK